MIIVFGLDELPPEHAQETIYQRMIANALHFDTPAWKRHLLLGDPDADDGAFPGLDVNLTDGEPDQDE